MKSFKEQLTEKAEAIKSANYDISSHMETIKNKIEECVYKREFTISLIEPKPDVSFAIGHWCENRYQILIPDEIEPHVYMSLFIRALGELGFHDEDIEKGSGEYEEYYYYTIKIKW